MKLVKESISAEDILKPKSYEQALKDIKEKAYEISQLGPGDMLDSLINDFEMDSEDIIELILGLLRGNKKFFEELYLYRFEQELEEMYQITPLPAEDVEGAEEIKGGDIFSRRYRLKNGRIIDVQADGTIKFVKNES
jgi:hypothetical protein